ncbi:MAG: hypothetical protein U0361_11125 [Nitrospiraceae bacterium]
MKPHRLSRSINAGDRLPRFLAALVLGWMMAGPASSFGAPPEMAWEGLTSGLSVSIWNPAEACPDVPTLLMLRIDPERFRFAIHHYHHEGLAAPPTIQEWQRRTDAYVVFNAGLFREDYSYLGLLYKDGHALGGSGTIHGRGSSLPNRPIRRSVRPGCWISHSIPLRKTTRRTGKQRNP